MGIAASRVSDGGWTRTVRRYQPIRTIAEQFLLWRRGLSVLRDWKVYADFLSSAYQQHNIARLQHLESLGLGLAGSSVLEIGAGIGDHTLFYLYRNCRVVAVEGRPRLARKISERLDVTALVIDLDKEPERLEQLGHFDVVHCYGLLYHLSNPARLFASTSRVGNRLLLETCVSFGDEGRTNGCEEDRAIFSQALHGKGCRPTRQWIFEKLKLQYEYVYATKTQPRHPEFPTEWDAPDNLRQPLSRAVFIASHSSISNPNLLTELPDRQVRW